MTTWHQDKAGVPSLEHPTRWRSYNPAGHLCVMTHHDKDDCLAYCRRTGDIPVPPGNTRAQDQKQ